MVDFWDPIVEASIFMEDGVPRFTCSFTGKYSSKSVTVFLDENATKKAATRCLSDGVDSVHRNVIVRIVDDLFDKFGASGHLIYDPVEADRCNNEWAIRMIRKELRRRGVPKLISRDQIDCILNELYTIEFVLDQ